MSRLIPNPVADINRKIDGSIEKVDATLDTAGKTLGKVGGALEDVDATLGAANTTLAEVRDLLEELRVHLELLQQIPAMAEQLDAIHAAVVDGGDGD